MDALEAFNLGNFSETRDINIIKIRHLFARYYYSID